MSDAWKGQPGHPGEVGEEGRDGGGRGGRGGAGGAGGDTSIEHIERIASLESRVRAHEVQCESSRRIFYTIAGTFVVVLLAMFWHLLLISGRQEVVLSTLQEHTSRMNAITLSGSTRDEGIRADIKELQREMQLHIQGSPNR